MKIKHLTVLLIILVLFIQPVSAGFLEDIFNKITGRVTENVTDEPEPNITEHDTIPEEETPSLNITELEIIPKEEVFSPNITEPAILPPKEPSKTLPPFVMAVWDKAPASDIILTANIAQSLINEGYALIGAIKLFSEIDALTDNRVILAVYHKGAVIVVREDAPPDYATFSADLKKILNQDGIADVRILSSSALKSSDLLDLFDTTKKECPELPEQAIKKCEETDGTAVKRFGPQGCPFIDCEYASKPGFLEPAVECPTEDMLREMEEKCRSIGIEPFIVKERSCRYVKCSGKPSEIKRCVEDVESVKKIKEECEIKGGRIVKNFDSKGCPITVCVQPEVECERGVPLEAHENCEVEGGNLAIRRDDKGCVRLVECVKRGNPDVAYEEVEEIPPAKKLLSIALKLESLKIQFDNLIRNLRGIVNYYEEVDDTARAERFRKALGLFSNANDKIEEVKVKLRERAEDITEEDLRDIKHDIKYISETVMQDALYIILDGEIEIEGSTGVIEEGYADCGNDNDCLEEALSLCEPAVLRLNENFAKIEGLEGEACILEVSFMGAGMVCKIKDYATFRFEGRDLFQYCEGKGREVLKMFEAKITRVEWAQEDCEGMIDSDKKERCYQVVAYTIEDGSLCEKITDSNNKQNCYFSLALKIKDDSLCAKITEKRRRDNCYEGVAVALKDANICKQLFDSESEDRSPSARASEIHCYNKVAIAAQDSSICERITKDDDETRCYCSERTEITSYDDMTKCACEEITRDNNIAKCRAAVAKDASICESITTEFTKDSCYSGVAAETKDASICESITAGSMRDGCYYNIHDRSLCDRITGSRMRDNCYGNTGGVS